MAGAETRRSARKCKKLEWFRRLETAIVDAKAGGAWRLYLITLDTWEETPLHLSSLFPSKDILATGDGVVPSSWVTYKYENGMRRS